MTLVGYSTADMTNGRLSILFGHDPARRSYAGGDLSWPSVYVESCSSTARDWRIPKKRISTAGNNAPGMTIHSTQPR